MGLEQSSKVKRSRQGLLTASRSPGPRSLHPLTKRNMLSRLAFPHNYFWISNYIRHNKIIGSVWISSTYPQKRSPKRIKFPEFRRDYLHVFSFPYSNPYLIFPINWLKATKIQYHTHTFLTNSAAALRLPSRSISVAFPRNSSPNNRSFFLTPLETHNPTARSK